MIPKSLTISKQMTDDAGEMLKSGKATQEKREEALAILSSWRARHSYPMHIFRKRLKRISEILDKNSVTAQRLKRVPSIIKKLNREYSGSKATMKLTQMQDIAGCRVVLSSLDLVNLLYKNYYKRSVGDIKHILFNEKDYIKSPKEDGYRSIHLVYKYKSDKLTTKKHNGLLIEVQIRTELQHIWATAVETVSFFTGQAIKSNEGTKEWRDFFKLVSAAFAMIEGTPHVPNTENQEKLLYAEIEKMEKEINVISKLKKWSDSARFFDNLANKGQYSFFLLELDMIQEKLTISAYTKDREQNAISAYADAEKKIYGRKEYDVVLVGTDTYAELKEAYPNYFIDTRAFIIELEKIIKKYK